MFNKENEFKKEKTSLKAGTPLVKRTVALHIQQVSIVGHIEKPESKSQKGKRLRQ
jgi:hypothetical protein